MSSGTSGRAATFPFQHSGRGVRAVGLGEEEPDLLCQSHMHFSPIKLKYMLNMDCESSRSRIQMIRDLRRAPSIRREPRASLGYQRCAAAATAALTYRTAASGRLREELPSCELKAHVVLCRLTAGSASGGGDVSRLPVVR